MARRRNQKESEAFVRTLRAAREQAGLTQAQLARKLRRPQSFVSKYERGEARIDILELRRICAALGISLSTLERRLDAALKEGGKSR